VQSGLRAAERGFAVGPVRVPIVPQAILMDLLNGGNKDWGLHAPYRDLGYHAYQNAAKGAFPLGTVGAGTGATTANLKGGIGSASAISSSGHTIAALVAVNAMGSVVIGDGPHFWAAPFEEGREFGGLGQPPYVAAEDQGMCIKGLRLTATTIGAVVTDCTLSKAELHRLSLCAHDGLARAVLPAHLPLDGDTIFSASTGKRDCNGAADLLELCHLATLVTARAIARGVFEAVALPYADAQPAWRDRWG
jgi:L-aminopeptidase/D-esterase-like protein